MTFDLEHLRSRNPIEEVVAEKFALKKSGSRFVGVEHDSLVVVPNTGFYFWNSRSEHGDVFDFVGRHILSLGAWNSRDATQFMEAVRYLAQRAGITLEETTNFKKSSAWAERQLIQRMHEMLLNTPAALTYVTEKRGWQLSTIKAARLGFVPQDKRPLLADLNLSDNWRTVIQKFPPNMIVYIHAEQGRLTYLSGRSIEGKKHYNPPRDIIGERQPYYNHLYSPQAGQVVIVEGQADAITFAEWGIAAVAIGGMQAADELLNRLKVHPRLFVALDNFDEAGNRLSESLTLNGGQSTVTALTYNPANQINNAGFAYDPNGNLIGDGPNAYLWDRANRLMSMGGVSYGYDGLGNRIRQTVGGIVTTYLNDVQQGLVNLIRRTTSGNTDYFVHGLHGVHGMENAAGVWSWALHDGLNSVRSEVNNTQDVLGIRHFGGYGDMFGSVGSFGFPFMFTGEPRDITDLQYHRARYYNPNLGGWTSLDPFEGIADRAMSLNGYSWVEGNVPNAVDPSGRCVDETICEEIRRNPNNFTIVEVLGCLQVTSSCCGPDATEWMYRELYNHMRYAASSEDFDVMTNTRDLGDYEPLFNDNPWERSFELVRLAIYGLAVDYGYVDYVDVAGESWAMSRSVPTWSRETNFSCNNAISLCGRCHNPTDFGNFVLGAVIYAAGEDHTMAIAAGTIFNAATDNGTGTWREKYDRARNNPDTFGVEAGYEFAAGGVLDGNFNRASFCSRVNSTGTAWFDTRELSSCSNPIPCCSPHDPNLDDALNSTPSWNRYVSESVGMNRTRQRSCASPQQALLVFLGLEGGLIGSCNPNR